MKQGVIIALVIVLVILMVIGSIIGVYNTLNRNYQAVKSGESQYSAALNTCTQKIQGVWEIANQYMAHESKTFEAVAEARSGYEAAKKSFENAKDSKTQTEAGTRAVSAALAFQVQVEAYPQLRAVETARENMQNLESSVNEIKTALDDWIVTIKQYNTYRGYFWPNIWGSIMGRFPSEMPYYQGEIKKLDINQLNPAKKE